MKILSVDDSQLMEIDTTLVKLLITMMQKCREFKIHLRMVVAPQVSAGLQGFSDMDELRFLPTLDEARVSF
jgi:ABC-type transporter Mla MlaB component